MKLTREDREPFNAGDPTDAMSEMFRRQVTDMALNAYKITIYRELNTHQQFECFLAGSLTGLIGVALASVKAGYADAVMEYIADCLPHAREMAESITDENGNTLKSAR